MKDERGDLEAIDERFENLESQLLYQDRTIDDLNEVVTKQQDQIDGITIELKRLQQAFFSVQEHAVDGTEEPPPPHY